jgi:hypothetical protein
MSMKLACLALGATLALAAADVAQAACARPTAPAAVDGATASMDQLLAAKKATMDFIAASDEYQNCVLEEVKAANAAAKKAKTKPDPAVKKTADDAISASQADKEQVGAAMNASIKAYKAAHPS